MLGRLFGSDLEREDRSITWKSLWDSDSGMFPTSLSGVSVTQRNALALSAVYDAVRIIADPICTLPLGTYIRSGGERRPYYPQPAWIEQPDPDPSVHRSDHYQALIVSLLLNGNYYGRILRDGPDILAIAPLDPTRVEPRKNERGFVEFEIDGKGPWLPASDIVHITELREPGALKGTSRIDRLRETFGIGKALDDYVARYFGSGTLSSGIVTVPGEMTSEQADRLKDQFEKNTRGLRNAHRPNVLSGGAKFERMSASAEEAQLTAARDFFVLEVSRAFKIPPSKLGVNTPGTRAYASVEQDNIDFTTTTLRFYVSKIEEAYSRLLAPKPVFLRMNMEALLRGDLASRFAAYSQATQGGWMSINQIARLEDWPAVDGGDEYRVPLANVDLGAAHVVEDQMKVDMAVKLIDAGADPAATLAAFGLPPIEFADPPEPEPMPAPEPADPADDPAEDVAEPPAERAIEVHVHPTIDATTHIAAGAIVANVDARSTVEPPDVTVNVEAAPAAEPVLTRKRIETDDKGRIVGVIEERA
jgi:HK97 family phage portal protein